MVVAALALMLVVGVWLVANLAEGTLRISGAALGVVLVLIVAAPLLGGGAFLFVRGREEVQQFAEVAKERQILNMVLTRGKLRISDAAIEMDLSRDKIKEYVHDLVGKGLFTGYINWNDGVLYAKEASEMRRKCPNCGGELELAGKGVFECPYCGTEIFLT
ncbi:MAG: PCI domain-containing protein [Anaerolineae bacterium]